MFTHREGHRLLGRVSVTLADVMRGAGFPDTLSYAFSIYDPHGWRFHPAWGFCLPGCAGVPVRHAAAGCGQNLLVCGKALPMEQDALNDARMAPDVMATGYLAGRVAGAAEHCETAG